jgi:hypothetical protein
MELQLAYNSLLKLKKSIVYEESEEEEDPPEGFEQQVDTMLSLLGSKLEGPQVQPKLRNGIPLTHLLQSLTFSTMTMEDLAQLNITSTGNIYLKLNSKERIMVTATLGQNELWSSTNLHRQLHLLENLVPRTVCNNLSIFVLLA